jgi:transposase
MTTPLSKEETAILIRAKRIQKEKNVPKNASVSSICSIAGIARKTGYKWDEDLQQKLSDAATVPVESETEYEKLKAEVERLKFENEGLHLAWEIHDVEKILAEKKDITNGNRRKRL